MRMSMGEERTVVARETPSLDILRGEGGGVEGGVVRGWGGVDGDGGVSRERLLRFVGFVCVCVEEY